MDLVVTVVGSARPSTHQIHGIFRYFSHPGWGGSTASQSRWDLDCTWLEGHGAGIEVMGSCLAARMLLLSASPLSLARNSHSERIAPNYKKHSRQAWRPCHLAFVKVNNSTLRNFVVLFGKLQQLFDMWTEAPVVISCHFRFQNLQSSSLVLGDPVGQWARNLGAWHDTRTGGTRDVPLQPACPCRQMSTDVDRAKRCCNLMQTCTESVNLDISALNHFCDPCKTL